ncbi:CAP domain-containing protein [Anatilimnocola sp. NA78]|uniref:CAP domain-containing protein n=1 Tax=Anatilimnocola sp. NA78 TaxID=3415683 RepID=UPI003CE4F7A5
MTIHDDLLKVTNEQRDRYGVVALGVHPTLQIAAQKHAEWMADNRRMSHTGEGRSQFDDRIRAAGPYPSSAMAENIAWGQRTAKECVIDWMSSAGHRRNMLNAGYLSAGFGAASDVNGALYFCALYGAAKPESPAPVKPPPPPPPEPSWPTPRVGLIEWLLSLLGIK